MPNIRPIIEKDINNLKKIIESTELFPAEMLNDMISNYLNDKNNDEIWLTYEDEVPLAIAFCAPEKMTEGTWNLYLIAVRADNQNKGIGSKMTAYIEDHLRKNNQRILIVETSGLDDFDNTRKFYENRGYHQEAVINEFYQEGESKIIYLKNLNQAA